MFLPFLLALGLLALGTLLLIVGAEWFLDGARDLALALGVSALVIGILLAGLEPDEMLTAAIASARGAPSLALGNVLGTNITIITLGIGISAVIFPLSIKRQVRRQALIATLISAVPCVLLFFGVITRLEGILLLLIFIGYTTFLFLTDSEESKRLKSGAGKDDDDDDDKEEHTSRRLSWKPVLQTFGGIAAMALGGPAIVQGALQLAGLIGVIGASTIAGAQGMAGAQGVVGATIVSFGTGAEMLALGVSAARKRQGDILVGGILGSFAYNLLVTLGLAATIYSVPVISQMRYLALPTMIIVHIALLALIWYGKIPRKAGILLIAAYVAYLIVVIWL